MPLALSVNWLLMNVLSAKLKKGDAINSQSVAPANENLERSAPKMPAQRRLSVFDALRFRVNPEEEASSFAARVSELQRQIKAFRASMSAKDQRGFDGELFCNCIFKKYYDETCFV